MNDTTKQTEEIMHYMPEDSVISDMARQSITNLMKSGKMQEMVDSSMGKLIKELMNDAITGYKSEFKASVEKYFKESLKFDPSQTDLSEYQLFIQKALTKELMGVQSSFTTDIIKKSVEKVIGIADIKEEYTLEEFLAIAVCAEYVSDTDTDFDGESRYLPISLHVEEGSTLSWIYFDAETKKDRYDSESKGKDKHSCKVRLGIRSDGDREGQIHSVATDLADIDGTASFMLNCKFKGSKITDLGDLYVKGNGICNLNITEQYKE